MWLVRVIVGPSLVWIFIGEYPSKTGILGGSMILTAIIIMAFKGSKIDKNVENL